MIPIFVVVLGLGCLCGTSSGFRFNTSTPTQCGPFTIQWDGGQEPFQFLLVPTVEVASGRILNITLPTGLTPPFSHTFDLSAPAGLEFLATMYDSTGFGTGGTTPVLTVGSSDDTSCLESNLLYDFTFQLSPASSPPQCSSQTITWPNNVSRPVNLFGLIPGGTAWQIPIPQQGTTYDWQVGIDDGTEYMLAMSDSGPYITGGSSPLIRVSSGSRECMNSTSPRSGGAGSGTTTSGTSDPSASVPSASVSGVGGSSNGGQANGDQANNAEGSKSSTNIGAIVGGTLGGVAFIALLLLLLFCLCRKRSRPRRESADPMIRSYGVGGESTVEKRRSGAMDLLTGGRPRRQFSDDSAAETREGGQEYQPSPFTYPDPNRDRVSGKASVVPMDGGNRHSVESRTSRTESRSMEASAPLTSEMGGTDASTQSNLGRQSSIMKPHTTDNRPLPQPVSGQRFVQHEDSGQVVDLPPRYDQLRTRNPDPE